MTTPGGLGALIPGWARARTLQRMFQAYLLGDFRCAIGRTPAACAQSQGPAS